eukprot:TRINITY_DN28755_c0_g1_i1.p1 TRINITY_DN28755_c0_g1~~TRINITY_DN28755_c0_g1_i1.p1  ORF type:complete len:1451 (-),score=180.91 TRINITY_DN28755_c0_g1_i1:162-4514(-)
MYSCACLRLSLTVFVTAATSPAAGGTAVDLPGVDVLSAGYDAATWNWKAGSSAARLFDLSSAGPAVHIAAIERSFTAPAAVTVITDGVELARVEDSCEGVATHFTSYFHMHQESTRFDVGFKTSNFSLGLSYHKDVREVYEAITSRGQAVGLSESWWGMYRIILPPPFLLANRLDTTFQQARAALKRIGTPKSDADQEIYNQVCCGPASFGTHYVGSLVVGARAVLTSFVNNSFHTENSEKTVSEQVSIGFQWQKLKASLGHNAKDVEQKLMKEFHNSSHMHFTWQPDSPDIRVAPAPWLAWEAAAKKAPAVVNVSVSSLAHLFFDDAVVMAHLQKTIDFYVSYNRVPTLRDIDGLAGARKHIRADDSQRQSLRSSVPGVGMAAAVGTTPVPGIDVVGCGFHAPALETRGCLFEASMLGSTWSNPYYPNISYAVPSGFLAWQTPESTVLNSSTILGSVDDYVRHSYYSEHHHSSGFLGFGAKTESKTIESYYRNFYAHRYYLALSMRQVAWYTLELVTFPLPQLRSELREALSLLPTVYDSTNRTTVALFEQFFEAFGTDVVTAADMGGVVWAESWFESCLSRMYSDTCITDEVTRSWWVFHKKNGKHDCDKRITEDFSRHSSRHFESLGGTAKVNISEWDEWALTVKNDPRPVRMTLVPLHRLLPSTWLVTQALADAADSYLKSAEAHKQSTVDALKRVRPPPAPVCHRDTSAAKPTRDVIATPDPGPRTALCPFVGYYGSYCPPLEDGFLLPSSGNVSGNSDLASSLLPLGVGLTIDISNGDLKLPAWDSNASVSTEQWKDPATGMVFELPNGLTLSTEVQVENVPNIRVFKNESELVSVWRGAYARGAWLGGEFGNSKSVTSLFAKFFTRQQSVSINQHPNAKYRLKLLNGWEKRLNSYAVAALHALPEKYAAETYGQFIDAWGTHVANETLVGGMKEQQVLMKDCVWQSPYLSAGLTDAQLKQYLAMDLAKAPTTDPFYTVRRQMSIDHRIGGNPELTDDTAWNASLSRNPALLKIYSYTEWSDVAAMSGAVSAAVVANLRKAVRKHLAAAETRRVADSALAAKQRAAELQGPRPVVAVVAHGRRGTIAPELEEGHPLTMKGFPDCPAGASTADSTSRCSTGVNVHSWNTHELNTPLRYERSADGHVRSVRCFDLDSAGGCIEHRGPWVTKGCSTQPFATGAQRDFHSPVPDKTVVAYICADCGLISSGFASDATMKCVCPGYEARALGAEDCYNTFTRKMPNYKQCDPRWKCFPYAGKANMSTCNTTACRDGAAVNQTNNICGSGCGITSSAMLLSYHGFRVQPPNVASWLADRGYRNDLGPIAGATCNGVSHQAICALAYGFDLNCSISTSFADLDSWVEAAPVIAHVRHRAWTSPTRCKFTRGGHYIVITARDNQTGLYAVSDPNSCEEANMRATAAELSLDCELVGFLHMFRQNVVPLEVLI